MNTKRWVAVVLAVVVLILSFGSGSLKSKINRDQDQKIVNSFTKNFTSVFEKMNENVLEMGNPSIRIAVIHLNGVISAQSSTSILSGSTYNHDLFMNELHQIYNDPTVQAVLLVVNSPGGGVYESAEIHRTLEAIIRDKEILPFMFPCKTWQPAADIMSVLRHKRFLPLRIPLPVPSV